MKQWILLLTLLAGTVNAFAQDEEEKAEKKGFKKENLFTGGSVSISFGNSTTILGANPVLGYRIADFIDAGIAINYLYGSLRYPNNDKVRQHIYGGGVFTRIFPINFLFGQAQFEHNFMSAKYIYAGGSTAAKANTSVNSMLVGGGIAQGRVSGFNDGFVYFSILVDVSGNENSPYTDYAGKARPLYRVGMNIPLFRQE
jgi:hypothetical protein